MQGKVKALSVSNYFLTMTSSKDSKLLQWIMKPSFLRLSIAFSLISVIGSWFTSKITMCNRQRGHEVVYALVWLSNGYFILETILSVHCSNKFSITVYNYKKSTRQRIVPRVPFSTFETGLLLANVLQGVYLGRLCEGDPVSAVSVIISSFNVFRLVRRVPNLRISWNIVIKSSVLIVLNLVVFVLYIAIIAMISYPVFGKRYETCSLATHSAIYTKQVYFHEKVLRKQQGCLGVQPSKLRHLLSGAVHWLHKRPKQRVEPFTETEPLSV